MSDAPKTEPPVYLITSVRDFLKVPPDRREDCLIEFSAWLACDDLFQALTDGVKAVFPETFEWIDDGEQRITAGIMAGDEHILVLDGILKGDGNEG